MLEPEDAPAIVRYLPTVAVLNESCAGAIYAVYVKPVGVPAVVTIAEPAVVTKVKPVTEEPEPVMAETWYVLPVA